MEFTRYEFKKIKNPINEENIGEQLLVPTMKAYKEVCEVISSGFEKTSEEVGNDLESPKKIDNTSIFEMEWEKTEMKLFRFLSRLTKQHNPNTKKLKSYQENPEKFLLRAINIIGGRSQNKILEKLNTQARDVFFHHAEAEMYRKVGLDKILERLKLGHPDDNLTEVMFDGNLNSILSLWINEKFPRTEKELIDLKDKLKNNKNLIDKVKDEEEKQKLIEVRTKLQKLLAFRLYTIVYSEKFFLYKKDNYSFRNAIEENQINCMVRGNLIHQLWKKYCGETTLAILSKEHFFSAIKLANGNLYSLDGKPKRIYWYDQSYYEIGKHEELYQASILNWRGSYFKEKRYLKHWAKKIYLESTRLAPNDKDFSKNLKQIS